MYSTIMVANRSKTVYSNMLTCSDTSSKLFWSLTYIACLAFIAFYWYGVKGRTIIVQIRVSYRLSYSTSLDTFEKHHSPYIILSCTRLATHGDQYVYNYFLRYTECFNDTYGIDCLETCFCMNGGTCDSAIGCVCADGWTGTNCTIGRWFLLDIY